MRRYLFMFYLLVPAITVYAQFSGKGAGTKSDPYQVTNVDELFEVRNDLSACYKLMNDIDLEQWIKEDNPLQGWNPIGNETNPFKGTFEGNNKIIKGLYINRPNLDNIGFWGCANGATIQNVCFLNPHVVGNNNVGIVVGKYGFDPIIFSNQYLKNANVIGGDLIGKGCVGGVVGNIEPYEYKFNKYENKENTFSLIGCFCSTKISSSGQYTGGICGIICSGSYSYYSSAGSKFRYYQTYKIFIEDNVFNGIIDSTSDVIGGIIGYAKGWSTNYHVGQYAVSEGLSLYYNIERNISLGVLKGVSGNIAGIFGYSSFEGNNRTVKNNICSVDTISIESKDGNNYRISNEKWPNNYAYSGTVIFANGKRITVEDDDYNGIGYGLKTLKRQSTYEGMGFDFNNQWTIVERETFPYNKTQSAPPVVTSFTSGSKGGISGIATGSGNVYVLIGNEVYESYILDNKWSVTLGAISEGLTVRVVARNEGLMPSIPVLSTAVSSEGDIPDVVKGDANGDGSVDTADVVAIVNHILGKSSSTFVEANADINRDNSVLVDDAVATVQLILEKQ